MVSWLHRSCLRTVTRAVVAFAAQRADIKEVGADAVKLVNQEENNEMSANCVEK